MSEKEAPSLLKFIGNGVKWIFTGRFLRPASAGQVNTASRVKRVIVIGTLAALGYVTYLHFFGNQVEIICMGSDMNLKMTKQITELRTQKYTRSALLPFRFMEIVYGNMYDNREYCEYTREVVFDEDGENLALGDLTRLGQSASSDRP